MKAILAQEVVHSYGKGDARAEVLKGFSLSVEEGEFVALMGPSGSGKSTFLHLAAGLIVPDGGKIEVGGEEVTAMGDTAATRFRRRRLGVVFQDFNLIDTLSAKENIVLPARLDGKRPDGARVEELAGRLGLQGKLARRPPNLSGGERQRVAIARALFLRPAAILADEPTGNLDAASAKEFCALLREINAAEHSAILLVTHDPVVAAAAGRVCFIKGGRIAADFASGHDAAAISARYLETYK
ncbi:MAG: ABC transporter ATP-binding protein [Kiritimatiellae bacterium]|nr:ABC transporter ATP-binding protein [Kiritimatiellia bacterium]